MRTALKILLIFLGLFAFECAVRSFGDAQWLPPRMTARLADGAILGSLFVPVAFILYPPTTPPRRRWGFRIFVGVIVAWELAMCFQSALYVPAMRILAAEKNMYYDGDGIGAIMFVMGWVPPLIVAIITCIVFWSVRRLQQRRILNDEPVIADTAKSSS